MGLVGKWGKGGGEGAGGVRVVCVWGVGGGGALEGLDHCSMWCRCQYRNIYGFMHGGAGVL